MVSWQVAKAEWLTLIAARTTSWQIEMHMNLYLFITRLLARGGFQINGPWISNHWKLRRAETLVDIWSTGVWGWCSPHAACLLAYQSLSKTRMHFSNRRRKVISFQSRDWKTGTITWIKKGKLGKLPSGWAFLVHNYLFFYIISRRRHYTSRELLGFICQDFPTELLYFLTAEVELLWTCIHYLNKNKTSFKYVISFCAVMQRQCRSLSTRRLACKPLAGCVFQGAAFSPGGLSLKSQRVTSPSSVSKTTLNNKFMTDQWSGWSMMKVLCTVNKQWSTVMYFSLG